MDPRLQQEEEEEEEEEQVADDQALPDQAPDPQPAVVCSFNDTSTQASKLTLKNNSPHLVQLCWVNFEGEEQVYNVLQPDMHTEQDTYSTHVWRLLSEDGETLVQYSGPSATLEVPATGQGVRVTVMS